MRNYGPVSKMNLLSSDEFRDVVNKGHTWVEISELLGYKHTISSNLKTTFLKRCNELQVFPTFISKRVKTMDETKGRLFKKRKNWWSAAAGIRKAARQVYIESGKPLCCAVCGYSHYFEVAHIKPVSAFSDDTPVSEINNPDNLIGLCPNHHWEFDNGLLKLTINKQL